MKYYTKTQFIGLILGPAIALAIVLPPVPNSLSISAWYTSAVTIFMAIYWITEPVPLYATALTPIVLSAEKVTRSTTETTTQFGHQLIFLFLGGFLMA